MEQPRIRFVEDARIRAAQNARFEQMINNLPPHDDIAFPWGPPPGQLNPRAAEFVPGNKFGNNINNEIRYLKSL